MKWSIPAKTFLLGEYAALTGAQAMVLTTTPCFELTLSETAGLQGIHPDSPAGRWWMQHGQSNLGLQWHDPYEGCGGLGASSAQFLGAYLASEHAQKKESDYQGMLDAYLGCAWQGQGLPPSGYDVLAQSLRGCVYLHKQQGQAQIFTWPFKDLAFLLLHTGKKLATHHHLQTMVLPSQINQLTAIVDRARGAFEQADSALMIDAINAYHQQLAAMDLVAEHSLEHIRFFKNHADVLAVKGCGALGSDVLLLVVPITKQTILREHLSASGWTVLATSDDLYAGPSLMPGNETMCSK